MDTYLKVLELSLDAKTWIDYIIEQTREGMKSEIGDMADIASGLQRLNEKVEEMKRVLTDYMPQQVAAGSRQYPQLIAAEQAFSLDDGYPSSTLLGKYCAVGTPTEGYDIQFLTAELRQRTQRDHPDWQIVELKK